MMISATIQRAAIATWMAFATSCGDTTTRPEPSPGPDAGQSGPADTGRPTTAPDGSPTSGRDAAAAPPDAAPDAEPSGRPDADAHSGGGNMPDADPQSRDGGTSAQSDAGAAPTGRNALVMAAPGQVSDEYLRSSDCYYLSTEVTEEAREAWNAHHETWRDVWDKPVETLLQPINVKSHIKARQWAQFPSIELDGVLNFNHLTGWLSDDFPHRNYKHVNLNLGVRGGGNPNYSSGVVDYHKEGVDYESGMTFWQGGTSNWLRDAETSVAIWQVHGGERVPMYMQVTGYGRLKLNGFIRANPSAGITRVEYTFPDQSHEAIHVLKFQYRLGQGGYFRVFYNGKEVFDSGSVDFEYPGYWQDFMNYSDYKADGVKQIIHMDRLYRRSK